MGWNDANLDKKMKDSKFECGKVETVENQIPHLSLKTHHVSDCFSVLRIICCVSSQATTLYLVQVSSLLSVWLLQFCNSMILGSLVLSFIVAALFIRHCQSALKTGGLLVRLVKVLLHSVLVLLLTFIINYLTK
ncbi:hypothetical protein XENOCAPTIV_015897, partial [Xenoophorus captivus]